MYEYAVQGSRGIFDNIFCLTENIRLRMLQPGQENRQSVKGKSGPAPQFCQGNSLMRTGFTHG